MKNIGKKERKLKQTKKFGKIGVSFLVAIISFLVISNNVSASTVYNFTNAYEYNNTLDYQWYNKKYLHEPVPQDVLDRIIDVMDSRGKYYVIRFDNSSQNDTYFNAINIIEYSSIPYLYFDKASSNNVAFRTSVSGSLYSIYFSSTANNIDSIINSVNSKIDNLENGTLTSSFSTTLLLQWWTSIETDYTITNNRQVLYYSNFDLIYNNSSYDYDIQIGDEIISNGDKFITLSEYLNPTVSYDNEYNFDKNITKLYGIDYMISRDDEISDNIQISFKYSGENKPSFNGIVTYALKNYGEELSNELYGWINGPGYSSIEDTGLSYGYYTETYEDNIYTLTISDVVIKNSEFKKIIVRFEFLWATDVSNILVKSNNLYSDSFRINSFGYDYIIDNFNTVYFSYINFSTTLEEYRGTFYLIDTLKDNGNYRIFPDYYSTDSLEFTDYIIPTDIYTNHYGYENITQFNAYIGTEIKTGFWLTHNFSEGRSAYYPFVPDTTTYDFEFLVAYKMNENLYFSTNMSEDNENAIITVELNENNEPNVIVTDIEISSDVVTSSDYKSFFTILRDYLNDLKETREYINELYNYFYYSLPRYLKVLHDSIIIFICFIFFIKVGVEQ